MLWVILMETKVSQVGCFQITGRWICYSIFSISHLLCFSRGFCQNVYEETIPFQLNFQNSISRCSILQKIKMSNFVILKWWPFEYKVKSWKMFPFLWLFFQKWKLLTFWIFHESSISVMISHFYKNDIYESNIVEITGRRTWQQNWKQPFDYKLVYILGRTVQDMVLNRFLRQTASDVVLKFLMLFLKSRDIFSWCFCG